MFKKKIIDHVGKQNDNCSNAGIVKYLNLLEHVWMITDLPQLHDSVHQSFSATFTLKNTHGNTLS